jgi:putative mycofactocin binding protein MftB
MASMLDEARAPSPSVALRPEPFGALAYHFGNRGRSARALLSDLRRSRSVR